ncbi:hypothetical protein [Halobacteriovorax sp.]|uniref:hypothetical protein n=1 Tax=Halobacteriovorax sp. TaxID=2020862 RepID=UPI003563189C
MKNENDQYSSSLKANKGIRKFEILQAEIILLSPRSSIRNLSNLENESISFSNDKILNFKTINKLPKRHLRLVEPDENLHDNVLKFQ